MPAPGPKPAPTARQILARYHAAHLPHGASLHKVRPDGAYVYHCSCGATLVVTAADLAKL